MASPEGYSYTKEHEWAKEENGVITVGITDYAQNHLGDIVYLDLVEPGTEIQKGKSFGTIESVKAAEDLYSPVSGVVDSINEGLKENPEKINSDPMGSWMLKIKDANKDEFKSMMNASSYDEYLGSLG
ncbi:MAG: glycine cleavage system protein GcvH [Spirochaetia bacterium]|nr:glycine cleavage system protein GcvH [Spirochaetia bacterium]